MSIRFTRIFENSIKAHRQRDFISYSMVVPHGGNFVGNWINSKIDSNTRNLTLPSYRYCGPGNNLKKQIAENISPTNKLDSACRLHDISYERSSNPLDRKQADQQLLSTAVKRLRALDSGVNERLTSGLVAGLMKAKLAVSGSSLKVRKKRHQTRPSAKVRKQKTKQGGFLPAIPLILGALSSLGSLATVAKVIKNWNVQGEGLTTRKKRHNSKNMRWLTTSTGHPPSWNYVGRIAGGVTGQKRRRKKRGYGAILEHYRKC